jgi:Fur family transcriptional regulator, ferric uptake regulator
MVARTTKQKGGQVRKGRETLDESRQVWKAFSSGRGLNESKVRDAVVETFFATSEHIDLQTLFTTARKRHPSVSYTTVYRTMKLLDEAGLAHSRHFGDARGTLYEVAAGRAHHDHLICDSCGRIVEFVNDEMEELQNQVAARHGFTLLRHRHELYGRCSACSKSRR